MKKKAILITAGVLLIALVVGGLGAFYYLQQENKKLTINYILSQSKGPEKYEEEIWVYPDDDEPYVAEATDAERYVAFSKDFNEIIKMRDANSRGIRDASVTYAFRVQQTGNSNFNYEIGRIVIDTVDKTKPSECSYNFRGNCDWFPCDEKSFIKSLPEISKLKEEAYRPYAETLKEIDELIKDADGDFVVMSTLTPKMYELRKLSKKQLDELRNITIPKK